MTPSIHASAVVMGESGILLRGPSGAGKSLLALALIDRAHLTGTHGALVADDRVWLEAASGRLLASGAPALAGLCEFRGLGMVRAPHAPSTAIRLIADIAARGVPPPRVPDLSDRYDQLCGVTLPRLRVDLSPGLEAGVLAIVTALGMLEGYTWRKNNLDETVFA